MDGCHHRAVAMHGTAAREQSASNIKSQLNDKQQKAPRQPGAGPRVTNRPAAARLAHCRPSHSPPRCRAPARIQATPPPARTGPAPASAGRLPSTKRQRDFGTPCSRGPQGSCRASQLLSLPAGGKRPPPPRAAGQEALSRQAASPGSGGPGAAAQRAARPTRLAQRLEERCRVGHRQVDGVSHVVELRRLQGCAALGLGAVFGRHGGVGWARRVGEWQEGGRAQLLSMRGAGRLLLRTLSAGAAAHRTSDCPGRCAGRHLCADGATWKCRRSASKKQKGKGSVRTWQCRQSASTKRRRSVLALLPPATMPPPPPAPPRGAPATPGGTAC
jgi:hypothetical protein